MPTRIVASSPCFCDTGQTAGDRFPHAIPLTSTDYLRIAGDSGSVQPQQSFIQYGYWQNNVKGITAPEQLRNALFAADTPKDAWALADAAHPEDERSLFRYIPLEKMARIDAD